MKIKRDSGRWQKGLSLIELMVSLTIGLLLVMGLASLFAGSFRSEREMKSSLQQIENGRYAMDMLTNDLHLAGYYGTMAKFDAPTTLSDPCDVSAGITNKTTGIRAYLGHAVQGYAASSISNAPNLGAHCATALASVTLAPGSDVLVVRRADSIALVQGTGVAVNKEVYIQANVKDAEIQLGNGAAITSSSKADGTTASLTKKDGTAAEVRKFHTHVYFVDSSGSTPTLKRLELTQSGGATVMNIATVAEGIEVFSVEYGIDDSPTTADPTTGSIGDGVADSFSRAPDATGFANTVSVTVRLVARSTEKTLSYVDDKVYDLGAVGFYNPSEKNYKRHQFASTIRLVNPASRREYR